jgi:AraC family transcriptional regulator, regulatory protein of adaptative response / methylated-DNA-[protein]-cysteine methyltransferase
MIEMNSAAPAATPASIRPRDYERIAAAIRFLSERWEEQPSLEQAAAVARLSPFHFQRRFTESVGVSPKRFVQHLTLAHARRALRADATVLGATYAAGLSGPGRLHDLFVTLEALTPGEHRSGGAGIEIVAGIASTPFGRALIGTTPRGVCTLRFLEDDAPADAALATLTAEWPRARCQRDDERAAVALAGIFAADAPRSGERTPLRVLVRGTTFQLRVWRALLEIPPGATTTYEHIARAVGRPGAARAAGQAIGRNALAWLIPCHRVIRAAGGLGGYRWGEARKRALLAWERAAASVDAADDDAAAGAPGPAARRPTGRTGERV